MQEPEFPRHESIQALLAEALLGETASDVIRRKARAIIKKHRNYWKGPAFCPFSLADLEGIIVREAVGDIRSDGRIFSKRGQVYIEYAQNQITERVHFTICHELTHTLFPDCFTRVRLRSPKEKAEWEFEDLCNIGASEFLFPVEEFSLDMGKGPLGASKIKELSERYKASVDATARRYVDLYSGSATVVFAKYSQPAPGKVVAFTVLYSVPNNRSSFKPHKGCKINSKSIANRAFYEKTPLGTWSESWMVRGEWNRLRVEAIPLPRFESKDTADLAIIVYPR